MQTKRAIRFCPQYQMGRQFCQEIPSGLEMFAHQSKPAKFFCPPSQTFLPTQVNRTEMFCPPYRTSQQFLLTIHPSERARIFCPPHQMGQNVCPPQPTDNLRLWEHATLGVNCHALVPLGGRCETICQSVRLVLMI